MWVEIAFNIAIYKDSRFRAFYGWAALLLLKRPFLRLPPGGNPSHVDAQCNGKYAGLNEALAVVKPGGFYVIDDMLPQPKWPEGHAEKIPLLMEQLAENEEFEILPLVGRVELLPQFVRVFIADLQIL